MRTVKGILGVLAALSVSVASLLPACLAAPAPTMAERAASGKKLREEKLAKAKAAVDKAEKEPGHANKALIEALIEWGLSSVEVGEFEQGVKALRRALKLAEADVGPDSPHLMGILGNLGLGLKKQDKLPEAIELYERSLRLADKAPNFEYPTATAVNLASIFILQEKYKKAEPLLKKALAADKKRFGKSHPEVAADYNALGMLYKHWGKYGKSKRFYKKALKIFEKSQKPPNEGLATTWNNLGLLHTAQGKLDKAEALFKKSIKMQVTLLGKNHPGLGLTFRNLAEVYREKGDYVMAEKAYKTAVTLLAPIYGRRHTHVISAVQDYKKMKKTMGAE